MNHGLRSFVVVNDGGTVAPVSSVPRPLSSHSMVRLGAEARAELRRLSTPRPVLGASAFVFEYAAVIAAALAIERTGCYWLYPLAVVFIAARQHSLYLLNHDASHSSLFRSRKLNQVLATWLANLPFLHHPDTWSFVQWRRQHLLHHRELCTQQDPYWVYRDSVGLTTREMTRPELALRIAKMGLMSSLGWITTRQGIFPARGGELTREIAHWRVFFEPFRDDPEMRNERLLSWAVTAAAVAGITVLGAWPVVVLYWIVPMYTVYPVLLELAEMTEHHWHAAPDDLVETTTSTLPGIFTKLFVSELNRTIHREHHLVAKVPCYNLRGLHRLLRANGLVPPAVRGLGRTVLDKPWRPATTRAARRGDGAAKLAG
jgi:fatty acid desaturase